MVISVKSTGTTFLEREMLRDFPGSPAASTLTYNAWRASLIPGWEAQTAHVS